MRVVVTGDVNDTTLSSTNIPEPDTAKGEIEWSAGTYSEGDQVILTSTHRKYEATTTTNDDPETGLSKSPPTWVDIGSTNRYACLGDVLSTKTIGVENTQYSFEFGELTDSVNGFGITGAGSVTIVSNSTGAGEVYNKTIEMRATDDVGDYFDWFFLPITEKSGFSVSDIPPYADATITVTFNGLTPQVGLLKLGYNNELGVTEYDSSLQLLDYSRKPESEFGVAPDKIVKRRTAKLGRFKVRIATKDIGSVLNRMDEFTGKPCVWVGDDEYGDATSIYGIYRDFSVPLSYPSVSFATLEILGLT